MTFSISSPFSVDSKIEFELSRLQRANSLETGLFVLGCEIPVERFLVFASQERLRKTRFIS